MRILVLTFYYRPDLCAGSFRTSALVPAIRERAPPDTQIDVVTTLPNRYHTFTSDAAEAEIADGASIHRIRLPLHRSDMLGQSRAFASFARGVCQYVKGREYDLVFATSSRLMTAALGSWIARRKRSKFYVDIRDIFADTMNDILPQLAAWPVRHVSSVVERWALRRADRINLVSPGFDLYFRERYPDRSFAAFTNGIDEEFIRPAPAASAEVRHAGPITILYAGNIGEGQGLHAVLPGLAQALGRRAKFIVIGDGGRRAALESALQCVGASNVEIRQPVQRGVLMETYHSADVLFLHLNSHAAFQKVLPSKLFEYAALGKPVLAGVAGYAARFMREEINNAAVFTPCNVAEAIAALESLNIAYTPRPEFIAKYARANIARLMAEDIVAVGREPR